MCKQACCDNHKTTTFVVNNTFYLAFEDMCENVLENVFSFSSIPFNIGNLVN
jgi:hypothetical protein